MYTAPDEKFPWDVEKVRSEDPDERESYFKNLIKALNKAYKALALAINLNLDHGGMEGLADDDHSRYIDVDGTRELTGEWGVGAQKISEVVDPTAAQGVATKNYVDNEILAFLTDSNIYTPDASEADQGVINGTALTVKYLVDTVIGATKHATIIFSHNGVGDTTTYTLTTSETIPDHITVLMRPGAILNGAGTLTVNGPFIADRRQHFGSSITISFGTTAIKEMYPQWWGAVGDGSTADDTPLAATFLAGSTSKIPVRIIGDFAISAQAGVYYLPDLKLIGNSPATSIFRCISANPQTALTQDPGDGTPDALGDVEIRKIKFIGNFQYLPTTFTYGYGIKFRGAADSIVVDNCEFVNFPIAAITCLAIGGDQALVRVTNNKLTCTGALIGMEGVKITGSSQAFVQNNAMVQIAFGVTMEIGGGGTGFDSKAVIITGNEFQDGDASTVAPTQEYTGVHVQLDTANTCEQLVIANNIFHDNVDDDITAQDIYVQCADDHAIRTCLIANNTIYNSNSAYMIRINNLDAPTVIGNVMRNPTRANARGIYIVGGSDALITGNTFDGANFQYDIIEISSGDVPERSRIFLNNLSRVGNIYIKDVETQGLEYADVAGFTHAAGIGPVTYVRGAWDKIPYTIFCNANQVSTSGTGEDTLFTMTIPADLMGVYGTLTLEMWGLKNPGNGVKTIKVHFGATASTVRGPVNNQTEFYFKTDLRNRSTALQRLYTIWHDEGIAPVITRTNAAEDTTGDVVLKVTGECAHANDTIYVYMVKVTAG